MAPDAPDPVVFYGYLFKPDNTPTGTLEALLRAIANYIVAEIGDKNESHLTPKKLAAFYRAVGGDYDRLLLEMSDSISFIWSTIGCQHSLQPTGDDFAPPCIPALTPRGFVRWQSVELLLAPALHVPFLQHAVAKWNLKHPDTGVPFPAPLPCEAFPTEPDEKMVEWHEQKLETLKPKEAHHAEGEDEDRKRAPNNSRSSFTRERRRSPRRPRTARVETDSSSDESPRGRRTERPRGSVDPASGVNYVHPPRPGTAGVGGPRRPSGGLFTAVPNEESARRRSVSDHPSPLERRRSPSFTRERPPVRRRYSQPRVDNFVSSDTESPSPRSRPKGKHGSDPALHKTPPQLRSSVRHVQPGFASPTRGYSPGLRPEPRPDDRRKSASSLGVFGGKLHGFFSSKSSDRPRSASRTNSHTSSSYTRGDNYVPPHARVVESDDSDECNSSERARRLRLRDRDRERDRELRDRDRERTAKPVPQRARERTDRDQEVFRERDRGRERERLKERQPEVYEDPLRPYPRRMSPYHRDSPPEAERRRKAEWADIDPERERERERFRPERRRRDTHAYRD